MYGLFTKVAVACACAVTGVPSKQVEWSERATGFTSIKTCTAAARQLGYTSNQQFKCIPK